MEKSTYDLLFYLKQYRKATAGASSTKIRPSVWIYYRWAADVGYLPDAENADALFDAASDGLQRVLEAGECQALVEIGMIPPYGEGAELLADAQSVDVELLDMLDVLPL